MRKCFCRYVSGIEANGKAVEVLDIGGADVNGSYRSLFLDKKFHYTAADLEPGPGVDVVLADPYSLPIADRSVDVVISGQAFEHIEYFWQTFSEMARVLKPDGFIFLIAPSAGLEHRYPVDCYRFYPDAYRALAKYARCELIDVWRDERGPWHDLVGVFRHFGARAIAKSVAIRKPAVASDWAGSPGSSDEERVAGTVGYLDVLTRLHRTLRPSAYLEIGVRRGASLSLASCPAIGVDPDPEIKVQLPDSTQVVTCDSDEFFDGNKLDLEPDLSFIDGMHHFEYALRDFMNIERVAVPGSAVVIDDIFPGHPAQAERSRRTRVWTGDVWKLVEILRCYRPDLFVAGIDTSPTGLALVAGLDPKNRVLWDKYNPIVRHFSTIDSPPPEVLARKDALDPSGDRFAEILQTLSQTYRTRVPPAKVVDRLRSLGGGTSVQPLKLSVVVVAYNMPRELPRTIRSLSPDMQRRIAASDYEIVVVDNGSTPAVDENELRKLAPNLRVIRVQNAAVSPVPAIQLGLETARGELVGVFIDGARMASPGLLSKALAASSLDKRAVIGTIAFHLGPKNQSQSITEGYDQATEDSLLAACDWENDGYRLFEISALAGSSSGGWFAMPAESNAVFMRADHWRKLGGYDAAFVTPGGGLTNLDLWARVCADTSAEVIMLLGEATFHQTHGGIATGSSPQQLETRLTEFRDEYMRIRGHPYRRPNRQLTYFGTLPANSKTNIASEALARHATRGI